MARSPAVHSRRHGEAAGISPGLRALYGCCGALATGTRQGVQAPRSICGSSACLCFTA